MLCQADCDVLDCFEAVSGWARRTVELRAAGRRRAGLKGSVAPDTRETKKMRYKNRNCEVGVGKDKEE